MHGSRLSYILNQADDITPTLMAASFLQVILFKLEGFKVNKFIKIVLALMVFVVLGTIAKGFNEAHHQEMALEACGSQEQIARVDEKGFRCKTDQK